MFSALADAPTATASPHRYFSPQVACYSCAPPLSEKFAQTIIAGFAGEHISGSDVIAKDIQSFGLGGVVLYDYPSGPQSLPRNISSPSQLQSLTSALQCLDPSQFIISTDQEGGQVARLNPSHGFPPTVSAKYLGDIDDPSVTYSLRRENGRIPRFDGHHLNFAPDVDFDVNPNNPVIGAVDRSFSADPDVVTRNAEAFIRAHHDHGILCSLKHFPGHGSSTADSHPGFVNVTDTWSRVELQPFANIVADGLADVIMTAHIFNANLDPDFPATLSYKTVTGILREQIGYDGVVISDDMPMKAITDIYGQEAAIAHAINAGLDILLFGNNVSDDPDIVAHVVSTMQRLVANGTISEAQIDQSYHPGRQGPTRRLSAAGVRPKMRKWCGAAPPALASSVTPIAFLRARALGRCVFRLTPDRRARDLRSRTRTAAVAWDVIVEPVGVGILFKRQRTFVELRPKSRWVALSIGLRHRLEHPRITSRIGLPGGSTYHGIRIVAAADIDAEVLGWLTESYVEYGG